VDGKLSEKQPPFSGNFRLAGKNHKILILKVLMPAEGIEPAFSSFLGFVETV
jgi:hypothetical protein